MKNHWQPLLIVLLTFAAYSHAMALTAEYIKCPTPMSMCTRIWDVDWTPQSGGIPCPTGGNSCWLKESNSVVSSISVTPIPGIGWEITLPVGALEFNQIGGSQSVTIANVAGFTFVGDEYYIRINSWPENPAYEGVQVSLDGKTVTSANTVHVLIPL